VSRISSVLHDENDNDEEEVQESIVTSWRTSSCWWCSLEIDHMAQCELGGPQRCEKISNSSSFGIIDIAEHSSTTDRIIVIVDTVRFIHDGAYR